MAEAGTDGYWGPVTSNVEWCEANYVHMPYVAELFNTVSSIPMIVLGLWGAWRTRRHASTELRYAAAHLGLATVGAGSVAFHATLQGWAQLMDEIPMLWVNLAFLHNMIELQERRRKPWLPFALIALGVALTSVYVFLDLFPVFLAGYGGVLAILIALSYHHTYRSGGVCDGDATLQRLSSSLFRTSFALYFGGLALWITDNVACSSVRPFHFHSLWHLGAGYGTYVWILYTIVLRSKGLMRKAWLELPWRCGRASPLPYVALRKRGSD